MKKYQRLAEQIRDHYPRPVVWFYWVQAEIIAMATDLAEFIGAAIGFKLILGVSLLQGAVLTGIATFLILMLQRRGQKPLEKVIGGLLLFVEVIDQFLGLYVQVNSFIELVVLSKQSDKELMRCKPRSGYLTLA